MIKTSINTFIGGMQKDVDKSILPKNKYLDAVNYRLLTTEGSTTGSLENVKGTKFLTTTPVVGTNVVNGSIIGSCQMRDDIILFVTDNTGATPVTGDGNSRIYKMTINTETEALSTLTLLYDDSLNTDSLDLNFSTANPIKAIAKYETPNVQKVYWTDGYNNIRYCNVAAELTVDAEAYVNPGDYMSVDKFEYLPKFEFTKPTLIDVVGGNVYTGMVAWSYQLYLTNGAETAFSSLSDPVHVVSDNDFLSDTRLYAGDAESINSGKGFVIEIDNTDNVGYNRLRLVRVHYTYINSTPEVFIVNEISINPDGEVIRVTDTGNTLGELTIDEFNVTSTELFTCQDIATKDNKLFAANIEKIEFDVDDWDARAVRFLPAAFGATAELEDSSLGQIQLEGDLSDWESTWGIGTVNEEHDGINPFNDPDNDGDAAKTYMYQGDGTTMGAEGLNIKIDFQTDAVIIDNSNDDTTFYTTTPTSPAYDPNDISYKNYASPWKGGKLSWQRDEVYRLFVVFGNDRGQRSDPKWIIDLRMPSLHDDTFDDSDGNPVYPYLLSANSAGNILSTKLSPRVYFKSFPTNATWAQIHRVKRERGDRFVVTQALAIPTTYDHGSSVYLPSEPENANAVTDGYELVKLVSPEINITKNISKQANDYVEYVTEFDTAGDAVLTSRAGSPNVYVHKLKTNNRLMYAANSISDIVDATIVSPNFRSLDYITIDGKNYTNYVKGPSYAKGCTGLLVSYDNTSWNLEGETYAIVNYKSNIYGSQYGGYTYEDRMNNVSIPCSNVIKSTEIDTWIDILYGDTFINYFDVSAQLADLLRDPDLGVNTDTVSIYVPLESSINCDLRYDDSSSHLTYSDTKAACRQEYAGSHVWGSVATYTQDKNLYLYNTVYSQQLDAQSAISLVVDKILETDFDAMIKASNTKSTGEITDSWTKFGINEFIEVDSIYGPVNAIRNFNDKLFYFQDTGFGLLAINDRSLIQDSSSSQLVLGTGGVLDRYDYATTKIGCQDKFSLANGTTGLFWYDRVNNLIIKYSDGIDKVSLSKGIQSYLNNNVLTTQDVISHPDMNNNEVLFTFFIGGVGAEDDSFTIAYSEDADAFVSFYSFIPNIYIPYYDRYLTTTRTKYATGVDLEYLFLHDSDLWPRCNFYGLTSGVAASYHDSTIKLLYNEDYPYTKTWDNIFYMSNAYNTAGTELYNQTIDEIRCYNDYQNTDYVTLTYEDNIRRRERTWNLAIPRNLVDVDLDDDPNIFAAGSLDNPTRTFRERLRDKYMIADLNFINSSTVDKFVLSNVGAKYRISYR